MRMGIDEPGQDQLRAVIETGLSDGGDGARDAYTLDESLRGALRALSRRARLRSSTR
jgi:hypothetical protein